MASIRLAVTPGFTTSDGTVTLQFTEPEEASDVKITVLEADRWRAGGQETVEGDGTERRRAEIRGTIQGRKFVRSGIDTFITMVTLDPVPPETKPKLYTPGIFNLIIEHDGSRSHVPLQNLDREKELGFFEIVFEVTATVGGQSLQYQTPTPVFVRNVPSGRAEIAFIGGTEDDFDEAYTKNFFRSARLYWKPLQDNLREDEKDLFSILAVVRDTPASARGDAPWGTVNIVAHGSTESWYLKKTSKETTTGDIKADDLPDPSLGDSPAAAALDEDSIIVLRGCELGGNRRLLDGIRDQFGGRARVYAPLHEMVYRKRGGSVTELLFQKWELELPGKKSFPADPDLVKMLQKKYLPHALYGSFNEAQWSAVAAIHETALNADAFRQSDLRTTDPSTADGLSRDDVYQAGTTQRRSDLDLVMECERSDSWNAEELEAHRAERAEEVPKYEWTWTIKATSGTNGEKFAISGVGRKTVFQIFRLLTATEDGQGPAATPDLNNPRHFGHSSSNGA